MSSAVMQGVPGVTPGCDMFVPVGWVCTDHMPWNGETVCIAGNSTDIVAAWILDDDRELGEGGRLAREPTRYTNDKCRSWDTLKSRMESTLGWFTPPTDEEVDAARLKLEALLKEMA